MIFSVGVPVQISVYKDKLCISNRAGFIESWGRGIEKICRLCKEYGIGEPEYTVHPNDIMMLFKANEPVNDDLLGKFPSNLEITYKAICEDNHASNQELALRTNQSERTIRNHTAKLKELNYIKRVGSEKTGHWEIL
ncbi:MAG: winged helix-turn-helix transcriptional regulator [Treponema sp.]